MTITDLQIKNLKARDRKYEVTDAQGLVVHVQPTGKKTFFYRYMFSGNSRIMKIGDYPGVSLAEARKRHADAMLTLQSGIDPGKKAQEEKMRRIAAPTFNDLLDEFWKIELSKTSSSHERKRLVDKDALPRWKNVKVTDIRRRDAVLLLDHVRERAPVTANRLQGVLVRMFNFAAERGMIDFSPLSGMRKTKEKPRSRVLTDDEIKKLWNAMTIENNNIDIFHLTKLALKAILLTGQRPGEVASMRWDQIKDDLWTIPAEDRKNDEENKIPILPMMAEILEQAKQYSYNSQYVFTSPQSPLYIHKKPDKAKPKEEDLPLNRLALSRALQRHVPEMEIENPFTPHDLRRTVRTRLAEIGISDVIAERVLGHKLQGILAVYNRHTYDLEKRQALALWEKRLNEILGITEKKSNVIPFKAEAER